MILTKTLKRKLQWIDSQANIFIFYWRVAMFDSYTLVAYRGKTKIYVTKSHTVHHGVWGKGPVELIWSRAISDDGMNSDSWTKRLEHLNDDDKMREKCKRLKIHNYFPRGLNYIIKPLEPVSDGVFKPYDGEVICELSPGVNTQGLAHNLHMLMSNGFHIDSESLKFINSVAVQYRLVTSSHQ